MGEGIVRRLIRQQLNELKPRRLDCKENAIVPLSESYHRCQITADLQLRLDRRGRLIGPRVKELIVFPDDVHFGQ